MAEFNMSKLWLGRDGNYRDLNGNIIAKKGQPITGAAWRYLASKYGRDYANRTSMNTRNGNIFQNGHWRLNDIKSSKEGRTASWNEASSRLDENAKAAGARRDQYGNYIQRNPFDNKDTYLNISDERRAGQPQQQKRWQPNKPQNNQSTDEAESIGGKAIQWLGDKTGLYHANSTVSDLAGTAGYFIPGVGNAMVAGDAYNAARRGDWGEAAMNAVFAIPFIGNVGRGLKVGLQATKLARAANTVGKGVKVLSKVEKPANWALTAKLMYDMPQIGSSLYTGYQDVKNTKQQLQPLFNQINQARKQGASESDIKNSLGDSYNDFNILSSRDNSFTGNLGTMWDLATN